MLPPAGLCGQLRVGAEAPGLQGPHSIELWRDPPHVMSSVMALNRFELEAVSNLNPHVVLFGHTCWNPQTLTRAVQSRLRF